MDDLVVVLQAWDTRRPISMWRRKQRMQCALCALKIPTERKPVISRSGDRYGAPIALHTCQGYRGAAERCGDRMGGALAGRTTPYIQNLIFRVPGNVAARRRPNLTPTYSHVLFLQTTLTCRFFMRVYVCLQHPRHHVPAKAPSNEILVFRRPANGAAEAPASRRHWRGSTRIHVSVYSGE